MNSNQKYYSREQFWQDNPDLYEQQEREGIESGKRVINLLFVGWILVLTTTLLGNQHVQDIITSTAEKVSKTVKNLWYDATAKLTRLR